MPRTTPQTKILAKLKTMSIPGLVWDNKTKDLVETQVAPVVFDHGDNVPRVSAEEGDGYATYYGPKGWPEIHPLLEQAATECGGFWEWVNPGSIAFYEV